MKILVDADACPVKQEIMEIALEHNLGVVFITNINCSLKDSGFSGSLSDDEKNNVEFVVVDYESDAADFAIVNRVEKNDIVVTQDYGLSAIVLSKHGKPITPTGKIFSGDNIDSYLEKRHLARKERKKGVRTKGPKSFSNEDRARFKKNLERLVITIHQ